jgi:hypothetical protein
MACGATARSNSQMAISKWLPLSDYQQQKTGRPKEKAKTRLCQKLISAPRQDAFLSGIKSVTANDEFEISQKRGF